MRKLAWFSLGFGGACLLSCYVSGGLISAAVAGVLFLLTLLGWQAVRPKAAEYQDLSLFPRRRRVTFQILRRAAALCLGGTLAFLWFAGYTALFYTPAAQLAGTEQTISGTVTSYP